MSDDAEEYDTSESESIVEGSDGDEYDHQDPDDEKTEKEIEGDFE